MAVRPADGSVAQTVMGNYEAIASCVATASQSSVAGPAALAIDRGRKTATLRRPLSTSNPPLNETPGRPQVSVTPSAGLTGNGSSGGAQYEINFVQIGATTVQVTGRSTPMTGNDRSLDFLWPHVDICATNLMAP